jgi:two-component system, chemotaxis family, sensor kinase CheA
MVAKRPLLFRQKVLGDHQTVVKSLGHLYRHQEMVSGATILGDGRVALILSVEGILAAAGLEEQNTQIMGIMS